MTFDFIDRKFTQKPKCELVQPDTSALWWCDHCNDHVYSVHVTFQERHDVCGHEVDPYCHDCENGGWVMSSYQASGAPNLEECSKCYNPNGYQSP